MKYKLKNIESIHFVDGGVCGDMYSDEAYLQFVESLGGEIITLHPGNNMYINPFDFSEHLKDKNYQQ